MASNEDCSAEIELSLGLSSNGKFGVDKTGKNTLTRVSSINVPMVRNYNEITLSPPSSYPTVRKTYSLPTEIEATEIEERCRKRKEWQSLRRMEAKRRLSEKQRNSKTHKDGGGGRRRQASMESWGSSSLILELESIPPQVSSNLTASSSYGEVNHDERGNENAVAAINYPMEFVRGANRPPTVPSPMTPPQLARVNAPTVASPMAPPRLAPVNAPYVFTKGDGPEGRRTEGYLYNYGRADGVSIMCICHRSFFSPAEFVRHGGGDYVDNPLSHIIVRPNRC